MELMDTSLDKFYKQVIDKGMTIPEDILGKMAVSVSRTRAQGTIWIGPMYNHTGRSFTILLIPIKSSQISTNA